MFLNVDLVLLIRMQQNSLYPILPGVQAWNIANSAGSIKRSVSIAYLICMGNAGGLIGSYIFIDKEAPSYPTGYGTSLAFATAGIIAALLLEFFLRMSNERNSRMTEEEVREKYSDEELERLGDRSPLFRYQL